MAKEAKKQSGGAQRSKARIAEANAKTAAANADAAKAQADADRIKADLEKTRIEADAKKRADEAAARSQKQQFDTAVLGGTYAAGLAGGKMLANSIDKKVTASVAVKNAALQDLAKVTAGLTDKAGGDGAAGKRATAKLNATVKVADKAKLTKVGRGPAGLITAAGLVALGLTTRSMADETEDETTKTILTASGTAEIVAGATVLYSDAAARAAPKALPDVKSLAAIEQGRAIGAKGTPELPKPEKAPAPKSAKTAAPGAKKANAASKKMVSGMTKAGSEVAESTAKAAGKAVAKGALRALGPVAIAAAAATAVAGSAQAGESTAQQVGSGVVAAADALTFGVPGMISDAVKSKDTIKYDAKEAARQANLASAEKKIAAGATLTRAEEMAVQEKAATGDDSYGVAERGGDAVQGAMGLTIGALMIKEASGFMRPGFVGRVMLRAGGTLAMAAGGALLAKSVATPSKPSDGKAYLNDAAKEKAQSTPVVTPAMAGAMTAAAMTADGQTDSYQRRTKSGKTVTVQGYRTPTR